jgi:excisionase family DNA binding protein
MIPVNRDQRGGKPMAKKEKSEEKILDVDARMQGTIVFKDPVNLRINGSFEGKLETSGHLTIGENAHVKADIEGEHMVIAGKVTGNLNATGSISLIKPAVIQGDVNTPVLSIAEGAILEGRSTMLNVGNRKSGGIDRSLNLREVAQYLEVEAKVVEQWAKQKKIPAQMQNGEWRFTRIAVDKWVQDEKVKS